MQLPFFQPADGAAGAPGACCLHARHPEHAIACMDVHSTCMLCELVLTGPNNTVGLRILCPQEQSGSLICAVACRHADDLAAEDQQVPQDHAPHWGEDGPPVLCEPLTPAHTGLQPPSYCTVTTFVGRVRIGRAHRMLLRDAVCQVFPALQHAACFVPGHASGHCPPPPSSNHTCLLGTPRMALHSSVHLPHSSLEI